MTVLNELTYLGQVRRLRRVAQSALATFGLTDARLALIQHGENTTFRVDAPGTLLDRSKHQLFLPNRYVLRVHRPGYQSNDTLASELAWLVALRQEADLPVPEPVRALNGALFMQAEGPGVPQPRHCSLLRWVRGRKVDRKIGLHHFQALGQLMARLHAHAVCWKLPQGFSRRHWDWEGLFGDNAGFNLEGKQVWARLPSPYNALFQIVADRTRQVMRDLDQASDARGLIHADLFLGGDGNVLFHAGEARPVDFDDCGFGYWVYDLAVPLAHWQTSDMWPGVRDALLAGYADVQPLPHEQLSHLDLFMAARHVSEILWAVDMAQVNSSFREALRGWMDWAVQHVRRFLEEGH